MKLLLLLVSLFVSDPSPLGDQGPVRDRYSWRGCRKLLLNEETAPGGAETLWTHMVRCWLRIQGNCGYVALQHKQWKLSPQAFTGIMQRRRVPVAIVFPLHKEGKRFPEFLAPDSAPPMCFISGDTSTAGGTGSIAVNNVEKSLRFVHHLSAVSSSSGPTFLLQTSKSWAAATIAQWQKTLTKGFSAAAMVIISHCLKEGKIRSAQDIEKISRRQIAEPQMEQKEGKRQARGFKYQKQDDERRSAAALFRRWDALEASAVNPGSSSTKTSDSSELEVQRNDAGSTENTEEPTQEQLVTLTASRVDDDDDDRLYGNREEESLKRHKYDPRPAQDGRKTFNGKKITQAEPQPPETERQTLGSIENRNQKTSANILNLDFTEDGETEFILLILSEAQMETQTEPASARTLRPDTDTGRKTVDTHKNELREPQPMTLLRINADQSECKCLQDIKLISLEMTAVDRTRVGLKAAESSAKATTVSAESAETEVRETTERREGAETNNAAHKNTGINQTKQEEKVSSDGSLRRPPPLTMKTDHTRQATTMSVSVNVRETTPRMEGFNQSSTRKADGRPRAEQASTSTSGPKPGTDSEPRCIKCKTRNSDSRPGKLFTGLRMREEILAHLGKHHKSEVKYEDVAPTIRPESGGKDDESDPGGSSLKFIKPLQMIHTRAPGSRQKATDVPACRGLIHRTAAGWKHCMERVAGSKRFSSGDATPRTSVRDPTDGSLHRDEYDHFYYFDGVLRRVQSHFYPHYRRQMSRAGAESGVPMARRKRTAHETLLSYIQRLVLKNRDDALKRSGR